MPSQIIHDDPLKLNGAAVVWWCDVMAVDKKTGYRTKQMLCMPIFGSFGGQSEETPLGGAPASPVPPSPGGTTTTSSTSSTVGGSSGTLSLTSSGTAGMPPSLASPPIGSPTPSSSSGGSGKEEKKLWPKGQTSLSRGEVVGVLQLINRLDEGDFTREDERLLGTFLKIAGPLLKRQKIFGRGKPSGGVTSLATANANNTEASIGLASSPGKLKAGSPQVKPRMVAPVLKGISEND
jgi:hypothetical protein